LVSQATFDLIVEFEGLDQPGLWPGEFSGISLGVGYDLALVTAQQFKNDWGLAVRLGGTNKKLQL
jgi:hypothetical protein